MIWLGPHIRLDNLAGIRRLLQLCVELAEQAARDAQFRDAARGLTVLDIFTLVRTIRIRRDPEDVELVIEPALLLARLKRRTAAADCEDIAALVAALGIANGFPARLIAYGTGERWNHIAAELKDEGRWIAVDPVAGSTLDTRPPTPATERQSIMPKIMVEGVAGLGDILASAGKFAKGLIDPEVWRDPQGAAETGASWGATTIAAGATALTEGATSLLGALSPGIELYSQYRSFRQDPATPTAQTRDLPAATVLQFAPSGAQVDTPAPIVSIVPYGPAPAPAPAAGINTQTLMIGGAILAALLLLKGRS